MALADHPTLAAALAAAIHPPIVLRTFHAYDEASLRRSLAHHVEIVAAVRAGDPVWARAVMTAHIHNARAVMVPAVLHGIGKACAEAGRAPGLRHGATDRGTAGPVRGGDGTARADTARVGVSGPHGSAATTELVAAARSGR